MEKIELISGVVAPLDRANVDTDAIMPKQFLKSVKKTGYGDFAFDEWRYLDKGILGMDCSKRPLNLDFSLNNSKYKNAKILVTRDNFGCGSSREHAVWGLYEYGFRCIIAPSFADIFYNNCIKNGLLLITLSNELINELFNNIYSSDSYEITISLPEQTIYLPNKSEINFAIDFSVKDRLMKGMDDIELTLQNFDEIINYELKRKQFEPWVFN